MPGFDFGTEIVLEDERVRLRPVEPGDYDVLQSAAFADPDILKFSPKSVHTPDMLKAYIEEAVNARPISFRYAFTIFDKAAGQYAGSTSFVNISNPDKRLEIGYTWYGPDFRRSGLNRHCKWLMLNYAFETLGFERVEFRTDERNLRSRTAIQRLGAKEEGILRSHMVMSDGFRRNTVYYSILRPEWETLRDQFPLQ
jgi:RimJ/RimL family protein N-acetyltransferase